MTDKSGNVVDSEVITEGSRGKDLILTVDMDLQLATEEIIEKQLIAKKKMGNTKFLDRAFVVMMDPDYREVLTMAGKKYEKDPKTGNPPLRTLH